MQANPDNPLTVSCSILAQQAVPELRAACHRARVVCASFLVKNLLLPWQWGLKHFWDCLLDADLEAAALGWQFCSGCLTGKGAELCSRLNRLDRMLVGLLVAMCHAPCCIWPVWAGEL